MSHEKLLETLSQKEVALHGSTVRANVSRLNDLLHESFFEFGRSGGSYNKTQILESLPSENSESEIYAQNFVLELLSADIALLRYQSFHQSESGGINRYSNRSSLWHLTENRWQLRFHQGTATSAFDIEKPDSLNSSK